MTTTHRPPRLHPGTAPAARVPGEPRPPRPGLLLLAAAAVLFAVGCITLGPTGFVADGRRAVMAGVETLTAPWPGTVHRAQVEAVANGLLFVPVGALAALALRRRPPVLPLALGAVLSVLIELAQNALPGRVPDLVDVAANTAGTAGGVALATLLLAVSRRVRRGGADRFRRGHLAALVAVPLVVAGATGCSSAGTAVPSAGTAVPSAGTAVPSAGTAVPSAGTAVPSAGTAVPSAGTAVPSAGTAVPSAGTAGSAADSTESADLPAVTPWGGGELTAEDGWLPDGEVLSPFADVPAITRLDPVLRTAVQDAAREAAADGVRFHVTTGWRSAAYQQSLFDDAVERYGSPEAARQWVLRPDESSHVTGDAVDVGPTDAMYWMIQHGADYGLCQTYGNEIWHFELVVERGGNCPAPAADPTTR